MFHLLFVVPWLFAALVTVAVVVAAVGLVREWRRMPSAPVARRAVRHADLTSVIATLVLAGTVAAASVLVLWGPGPLPIRHAYGPVLAALAPACALPFVAVHAVGELTWPRPRGVRREARVVARTPLDVTPVRLGRVALGWFCVLLVAAAAFALMASGPQAVSRVSGMDKAFTVSPFPGLRYTVAAILAAVALGAATMLVVRLVAVRPAVSGVDDEWDMWLRRRTARRVLRATQLALGGTLAGVVGLAGVALHALGTVAPIGRGPAPQVSIAYMAAGGVLMAVAVMVALVAVVFAFRPSAEPAPAIPETVDA